MKYKPKIVEICNIYCSKMFKIFNTDSVFNPKALVQSLKLFKIFREALIN